IRDDLVTGVQTCALPILLIEQKKHQSFNQQRAESREIRDESQSLAKQPEGQHGVAGDEKADQCGEKAGLFANGFHAAPRLERVKIGRASCRERLRLEDEE